MKKILKKITSVLLAAILIAAPLSCTASAFSYPENVSESDALSAVGATDRLSKAAAENFSGKSLKELMLPKLYCSETLSKLLVGVYSSIAENAAEIKKQYALPDCIFQKKKHTFRLQ